MELPDSFFFKCSVIVQKTLVFAKKTFRRCFYISVSCQKKLKVLLARHCDFKRFRDNSFLGCFFFFLSFFSYFFLVSAIWMLKIKSWTNIDNFCLRTFHSKKNYAHLCYVTHHHHLTRQFVISSLSTVVLFMIHDSVSFSLPGAGFFCFLNFFLLFLFFFSFFFFCNL